VLLALGGEVDKARRFMPWLAGIHAVPIMEQRALVDGFVRAVLEPLLRDTGPARGRLGLDQLNVPLLRAIEQTLPDVQVPDGDAPMQAARLTKTPEEIGMLPRGWGSNGDIGVAAAPTCAATSPPAR
jgi:Xaa-Pro dipeptidase